MSQKAPSTKRSKNLPSVQDLDARSANKDPSGNQDLNGVIPIVAMFGPKSESKKSQHSDKESDIAQTAYNAVLDAIHKKEKEIDIDFVQQSSRHPSNQRKAPETVGQVLNMDIDDPTVSEMIDTQLLIGDTETIAEVKETEQDEE